MSKKSSLPQREIARIAKEIEFLAGDSKESEVARYLVCSKSDHVWEGYQYIPPGSVLESIVQEFEKKSHAPLEVPLFVTLSILATHLLSHFGRVKTPSFSWQLQHFFFCQL